MKKIPTGIAGFDKVTDGGLPRGRPTLISGGPGCGKSLFALSVIAHAAETLGENAVFLSFEERPEDIIVNARSIGIDLEPLIAAKKILMDYAGGAIDKPAEIGTYNLDGLIIRLTSLLAESGATVVAIDTIETLYTMFDDPATIRRELARLFSWFKDRAITLVITGESGSKSLTRYQLEEYVSDCVVLLTHSVKNSVSTRHVRIVKYRGTRHGTGELPFIIDTDGILVMPVTAAELDHEASLDRLSTGLARVDVLLGGGGLRRGGTVLLTGQPGSGKTLFAMSAAQAATSRGEKVVFFSFEESPDELKTNVASIGIDLQPALDSKLLILTSARPTLRGLEHQLVEMYRKLDEHEPVLAVIDPLSGLYSIGSRAEVYRALIRLVDTMKRKHITFLATLNSSKNADDSTDFDISPMSDVWIHFDYGRKGKQFRRTLTVNKARGTSHEHGHTAFEITSTGLEFNAATEESNLEIPAGADIV